MIDAFHIAQGYLREVLVEERFEGRNYRVLVINGKMIAASERVPCHVLGDVEHTVTKLIDLENENPLRGEGHEKPLTKIKVDPILLNRNQRRNRGRQTTFQKWEIGFSRKISRRQQSKLKSSVSTANGSERVN